MKTLILKALGVRGLWIYLVQLVIEMFLAQRDIKADANGDVYLENGERATTVGEVKQQRVLMALKRVFLSSEIGGKLGLFWPAIKAAAIEAIRAVKALYKVLNDAFEAVKEAKAK